jgi:hypothetical protein
MYKLPPKGTRVLKAARLGNKFSPLTQEEKEQVHYGGVGHTGGLEKTVTRANNNHTAPSY